MSTVLTRHQCGAGAAKDMVGLKFGPQRFLLYYQTAFEVAAGICMSAKHASAFEGVRATYWSDVLDKQQLNGFVPLSRMYRRTQARTNIEDWSVGFENNLVVMRFDRHTIKIHYSDAFELYGQVRHAARNAKRWAGDSSRQWTTRAVLRDAEDNDKIVYAD